MVGIPQQIEPLDSFLGLLQSLYWDYPDFLDSFSSVDFSQLRAEGVGMLLTHPLKEKPAIDAPIPCSLILAKKVAAL
jgi:hypothetical protein